MHSKEGLHRKICKKVSEDPKIAEILEKAVEHERRGSKKEHYLGWEWSDVKAWPATLSKLVVDGIVDISYKSRRYTNYKLADRETVEKALKECRSPE